MDENSGVGEADVFGQYYMKHHATTHATGRGLGVARFWGGFARPVVLLSQTSCPHSIQRSSCRIIARKTGLSSTYGKRGMERISAMTALMSAAVIWVGWSMGCCGVLE